MTSPPPPVWKTLQALAAALGDSMSPLVGRRAGGAGGAGGATPGSLRRSVIASPADGYDAASHRPPEQPLSQYEM